MDGLFICAVCNLKPILGSVKMVELYYSTSYVSPLCLTDAMKLRLSRQWCVLIVPSLLWKSPGAFNRRGSAPNSLMRKSNGWKQASTTIPPLSHQMTPFWKTPPDYASIVWETLRLFIRSIFSLMCWHSPVKFFGRCPEWVSYGSLLQSFWVIQHGKTLSHNLLYELLLAVVAWSFYM